MRRIFCLLALSIFAGCVTLPVISIREKKIDNYQKRNPAVSAEMIENIRGEIVMKGMNMDQVKLTWGEPGDVKTIPYGGGKKETIWYYYDKNSKAGGFDDASIFAQNVPSKRIIFNKENLVEDWKIYDEELATSPSTALTKTLPRSVLTGGKSDGQEIVRSGEYYGWPHVVLSTIVNKGSNGAAVLNGRIVGVGESIHGVELMAVGTHGVKLRYKNQIGILKKGESTR